jgi:MYXO-CTERM domain-containing protein
VGFRDSRRVATYNGTPLTDVTYEKIGGGTYRLAGIPDGMGAYDNGNGTFTLLVNHELGATSGIARAHGASGAFYIWPDTNGFRADAQRAVNSPTQNFGWIVIGDESTTRTAKRFDSRESPTGALLLAGVGLGLTRRRR